MEVTKLKRRTVNEQEEWTISGESVGGVLPGDKRVFGLLLPRNAAESLYVDFVLRPNDWL